MEIPKPTPRRRLVSATLAMQSLQEQAEHVREIEGVLNKAIAQRNEMIQDAMDMRIRLDMIASATGLSPTYVRKIRNAPRIDPKTMEPPYAPEH